METAVTIVPTGTDAEWDELEELEQRLVNGEAATVAIMQTIHDRGLYKLRYDNWDDYENDFSSGHIMRKAWFIKLRQVLVSHNIKEIPRHETHVRELRKYGDNEDALVEKWQEVVNAFRASNESRLTERFIREVLSPQMHEPTEEQLVPELGSPYPASANEEDPVAPTKGLKPEDDWPMVPASSTIRDDFTDEQQEESPPVVQMTPKRMNAVIARAQKAAEKAIQRENPMYHDQLREQLKRATGGTTRSASEVTVTLPSTAAALQGVVDQALKGFSKREQKSWGLLCDEASVGRGDVIRKPTSVDGLIAIVQWIGEGYTERQWNKIRKAIAE